MKIKPEILQKGRVVSIIEASNEIGVHFTTLYRWIQSGKIVFVSFGDTIFIPVAEVERVKNKRNSQAAELAA